MKLSEQLTKQAHAVLNSSPEVVAIGLLKSAGMSDRDARVEVAQHEMEKAAVESLQQAGIDLDTAKKMVKSAGIRLADTESFSPELSQEEALADRLFGMAKLASDLESRMESMEAALAHANEPASELPDSITKLAASGNLTFEDLAILQQVPKDTLEKIAAATDSPWQMGKAASFGTPNSDPLQAWLMS